MFVLSLKDLAKITFPLLSLLLYTAAVPASQTVKNPNWKKSAGQLSQVAIGPLGALWGIDKFNHMFVLNGDAWPWTAINGSWKHVSPGESGVWAVNNGGQIYYREGVTLSTPMGTSWTHVAVLDNFVQVDSGSFGDVYSVNRFNVLFCRQNISPKSPLGTNWNRLKANMKYVSCSRYGCWAISKRKRNNVLFGRRSIGGKCKRIYWANIEGNMKQIEVDPYGVVYGVDAKGQLWVWKLVSAFRPRGQYWKKIPNTIVAQVTAGANKLLALGKDGTIYDFEASWLFTPKAMKQIDTGMTKSVWGVNGRNEVFQLTTSINRWRYIGKNTRHVTSGGAGVWSIDNQGDVFYRIESVRRAGNKWSKVGGVKLKQIDSGPYGVVYGVSTNGTVFCRDGIEPGTPTGKVWMKLKNTPKLSNVSCGALGCWGVNMSGYVWYRHGVSIQNCSGTKWSLVSGRLRQIEVGADGNVCGVDHQDRMYHRIGVKSTNVLGTAWMVMLHSVSHVTTGVNGQYVVVDGSVYRSPVKKIGRFLTE